MPVIPFVKSLRHRRNFSNIVKSVLRYLFGKRGKRLVYGLRLFYRLRLLMILGPGKPLGNLSRGREVRVWIDGRESFRRIERLIGRAKNSLVVQMFIWKDDETGRRMAGVILAAARRGVEVNISKEAVGDLFELQGDFFGTKESDDPMWREFWSHQRIHITYGTNNDHAKVYVIDDHILLLTGMNIANEYHYQWHDYMVELRGSEYVAQFLSSGTIIPKRGGSELCMNTAERKDIRPALNDLLDHARESVVVEHCYISDPEINDRLIALSRRDVRVTIIIPQVSDFHYHANMNTIGRMISEGKSSNLRVLLYPGNFHAKIILVDYKIAFLGSANLMKNSLDDMGEVNVIIRDKRRAIRILRESLREDAFKSRAVSSLPSFLWFSRWLAWLGL